MRWEDEIYLMTIIWGFQDAIPSSWCGAAAQAPSRPDGFRKMENAQKNTKPVGRE